MREHEILIDDIPEEGLSVEAAESDAWLAEAVREAVGEAFDEGSRATLAVELRQLDGNVNLDGEVALVTHPACDRCLATYEEENSFPLHAVLAPMYENERQREREERLGVEPVKEDLEFGFYEGDRFDLADVVRELIVLSQPMKHLCREECKGLCQRCGEDLNQGPCSCPPEEHHGPFEALQKLKPNVKAKPTTKPKAKPKKQR